MVKTRKSAEPEQSVLRDAKELTALEHYGTRATARSHASLPKTTNISRNSPICSSS